MIHKEKSTHSNRSSTFQPMLGTPKRASIPQMSEQFPEKGSDKG